MASLGFKIADGYVEVHADYDKAELHKAAKEAADDFGSDKEHERGGKEAGTKAGRGFTSGLSEEQRRSCTRELHKRVNECFEKQQEQPKRWGRRMLDRLKTGMTDRERIGNIAAAFASRFVEAVSFGQADFPMSRLGGPMAAMGAKLGVILGVAVAAGLVAHIGNAITALLPIALGGALAAIPIADLIFRNVSLKKGKLSFKKSAIGQELKKFIREAQSLADGLGKVFAPTMLKGLRMAASLFEQLQGPLSKAVKAISPGVLSLWSGFLNGIWRFGQAFKPALAGINAGLKEWGVQLPIIGRALGQAFSTILRDPALVRTAVRGLSSLIQTLAKVAANLVVFLTVALGAWHNFWAVVHLGQDTLTKILGLSGAFTRIGQAWAPLRKAILDVWDALKKFATATNAKDAARRMKDLVDKIKAVWKPLQGFLHRVFKEAWRKVKEVWNTYVVPWWNNTAKPWLKKKFEEAMRAAGQAIVKEAKIQLAILKARALAKLAELVLGVKKKAEDLVRGFIAKFKTLPGKAATEAGKVKARIKAKFAGAAGWLYQAGKDIISGLIRGLLFLSPLGTALATVTGFIESHKGPPAKDKKLLVNNGRLIMQGLLAGLQQGTKPVERHLGGLTKGMPTMAAGGRTGRSVTNNHTFSPTIQVTVQAGLDPVDGAARRALVRSLHIELDKFQRSYA